MILQAARRFATIDLRSLAIAIPLLGSVLGLGSIGCNNDAYCFADCEATASGTGGSMMQGSGGSTGALIAGTGTGGDCFPNCNSTSATGMGCMPSGDEVCDGKDNDCNGKIDDVDETNPHSCGGCAPAGKDCFAILTNNDPASITCTAGVCKGTCAQDYFDLDGDGTCEYFCQKTADTDVTCDNRDDDCNGVKDDGVNTCTDATNCGGCGVNCVVLHGTAACLHDVDAACDTTTARCAIAKCDDGYYDLDGSYATGCEYQCNKTSDFEICGDGVDNDCNGKIDSIDDTSHDPKIGTACNGGDAPDGSVVAKGVCAEAAHAGTWQCGIGGYQCVGPNVILPGTVLETCNGKDDDCDGTVDNSPTDAGAECGTSGIAPCQKGHMLCQAGALKCVGAIEPALFDGCDGIDNDCDGIADNHPPPGEVGACDVPTAPPAGSTSACHAGTYKCTNGALQCVGSAKPKTPPDADTCNFDGNCDGIVPTPDYMTDVKNCGGCGKDCVAISAAQGCPGPLCGVTNANWTCEAGACKFASCKPNFYDLDGDKKCEYPCTFRSAVEVCNGLDDNCDGRIDENPTKPSPTQVCGVNPAATAAECTSGVTVACVNGGWQCKFPAGVCSGTTACTSGNCCSGATEVCEDQYNHAQPGTASQATAPTGGLDNNCNGLTNENVANWGKPCNSDDGKPAPGDGQCQSKGFFYCSSNSATACGARKDGTKATQEVCDGVDNDCDGLVDESKALDGDKTNYVGQLNKDTKSQYVKLSSSLWIMAFEASRPLASPTTAGSGNGYYCSSTVAGDITCGDNTVPHAPTGTQLQKTVACSVANRLPWFNVTPIEAEQTCKNRGGHLCTTAEWQTSCHSTTTTCKWGYGTGCGVKGTAAKYCNLNAYTGFGDAGKLLVTGTSSGILPAPNPTTIGCFADWAGAGKVFDMTGNLHEITKNGVNDYPLMGGAYDTEDENGATCDFDFYDVTTSFQLYDAGFRCCFSTDPT